MDEPDLTAVQSALDAGDTDALREAILRLDDAQRDLLRAELGERTLEEVLRSARRLRRATEGRVVVLHGVMGSELDVVRKNDRDRVWIHLLRLAAGRMADLALDGQGEAAKPGTRVEVAGLHRRTYLPLVNELATRWDVRPFLYDWREDIDRAADRLAGELRTFGAGRPVHLVAHSMGGLVARSMIRRHPDVWNAIDDADGHRSGGRLVMLGTPNLGSYAIPLVLCGEEQIVKQLTVVDLKHDRAGLLRILHSFPGCYQMLPSPLAAVDDEREKLYTTAGWGALPARADLLELAGRFHRSLADVRDPERLLYVAGFGQETPFGIRVESPGRFLLRTTRDGDGRVAHALGLLPDVATFWVRAAHGDLPRDERVLDGIHDLLLEGHSDRLGTAPERRGGAPSAWKPAEDVDPSPAIATVSRGAPAAVRAAAESVLGAAWLGSPATDAVAPAADEVADAPAAEPPRKAARPKVRVEVVWGDVTRADGDVYCVGHYQGVLPQRAEGALDAAISGVTDSRDEEQRKKLVLLEHTRLGLIRGALGDINYFPWTPRMRKVKGRRKSEPATRFVAVAGMGHPGYFELASLRRLVQNLYLAIGALRDAQTVCTVLIGSGEGTLTLPDAVHGLVDGLTEAFRVRGGNPGVETIRIVELERGRADDILHELRRSVRRAEVSAIVDIEVRDGVLHGEGGITDPETALGYLLRLSHSALGRESGEAVRQAIDGLIEALEDDQLRTQARRGFERMNESPPKVALGATEPPKEEIPRRASILDNGDSFSIAAITDTVTVAERVNRVDRALIDEIIAKASNPDIEPDPDFAVFLLRILLPSDLHPILDSSVPFVFEVDRAAARIQWEMIARTPTDDPDVEPFSVSNAVARQLRTGYSAAPGVATHSKSTLSALVIGDPGDPELRQNLPGARAEAIAVAQILRECGVEPVQLLIGAEGSSRRDLPPGALAASRVDTLKLLMGSQWDILHYAGHGDFRADEPGRAGWIFKGGRLTAGEIERVDRPPRLVFANACLSGLTSDRLAGGGTVGPDRQDTSLVASLADQFFRQGVRNYIGTAWEISDVGAIEFASVFYRRLLGFDDDGRPIDGGPLTVGEAVRQARERLWHQRHTFGKLWAAYQHYGDPTAAIH